ncbi:Modulator of FtsH protease HflK [Planctomycetes bacterium Poly30]|uniref:Modulator of FtsH protease HflK n=1 Tax=Saltatorellus ferox TaxID=2528018 RepID=A0A518ERH5_9BACT|nr:Modulator of FtsH protease HflK [Planctomycetes bacterium Poly30]
MKPRTIAILAGAAAFFGMAAYQSFVTLDNDERGVVERFGNPVRDLLPGLHLKLPFGIERVRRVPAPERSLPMPVGYRLIDEKLGRSPKGPEKEWLTGDSNIVEIKASVLYAIRDPRAYLYGASSVTDLDPYNLEPSSPDFAIRRVAEAALTEIIGSMPVTEVITSGAASIAVEAKARIQEDVDQLGLGVEIVRFQLLDSGPLASVEPAFRAVQDAKAERDQHRNRAETAAGEMVSQARRSAQITLQEARSRAERLVLEAQSEADQFEALQAALGDIDSPATVARRLEMIQELLNVAASIHSMPATAAEPAIFYTDR